MWCVCFDSTRRDLIFGLYCLVGLFVLYCVWCVCLDCSVCGGFVWTVLCVVGLFGQFCVWWVCLDNSVCGGFVCPTGLFTR